MDEKEIIRGMDALTDMLANLTLMGKDALTFIVEKKLWDSFMIYHCKQEFKRRDPKDENKV